MSIFCNAMMAYLLRESGDLFRDEEKLRRTFRLVPYLSCTVLRAITVL